MEIKKIELKVESLIGAPRLNYQTQRLIHLVMKQGQGAIWDRAMPDGCCPDGHAIDFTKYTPYVAGKESEEIVNDFSEKDIAWWKEINRQFEFGEYELVITASHSWFDEGGQAIDFLLANQKARTRVWDDTIYTPSGNIVDCPVYGIYFWADFAKNPDDYRLLSSGPQ